MSTVEFGETQRPQCQIFSYTDANHIDRKLNQTFNKITASAGLNLECLEKKRVHWFFAIQFAWYIAFILGTGMV